MGRQRTLRPHLLALRKQAPQAALHGPATDKLASRRRTSSPALATDKQPSPAQKGWSDSVGLGMAQSTARWAREQGTCNTRAGGVQRPLLHVPCCTSPAARPLLHVPCCTTTVHVPSRSGGTLNGVCDRGGALEIGHADHAGLVMLVMLVMLTNSRR
jgi:hypothetical protein